VVSYPGCNRKFERLCAVLLSLAAKPLIAGFEIKKRCLNMFAGAESIDAEVNSIT
jgi:hypothetical protein